MVSGFVVLTHEISRDNNRASRLIATIMQRWKGNGYVILVLLWVDLMRRITKFSTQLPSIHLEQCFTNYHICALP